ncbi:MAG: DUF5103 domain-containing protein [Flavobacteriaceae bacterium]|nr:DUF5103 domain-containing protein [Bacteroidia bacterium]NNL16251.1 DUF5103 domain-containing protein [Flavobacteriaceae bacterium]
MLKKYFCLVIILCSAIGFGQIDLEVNPPEYIKTINFKGNTSEGQLPLLKLGDKLILEFDALNGEEADFYYKIQHYDYNWNPSVLVKSEYLNGFDNQRILDYENSFNTFQIYSHYLLQIPNSQTRGFLVSGNYMLKIYDDYDNLVFSRKFMVYEDMVGVGVEIKRSRDVSVVNEKQSVDITVSSNRMKFNNPKETVKTVIIQNNNLNTAITGLKPLYTIGNQLIYKYNTETSFWAGNEYLFIDTKDLRVATLGTRSIALKELYHNYLFTDIVRADRPYTYNPDINGNFVVSAIDRDDPAIEADYAWIHFSLQHQEMIDDKSIHVYGNFNNYAIESSTKLTFDDYSKTYSVPLLLKQGFYNYKYVVVDNNGNLNEGEISGDFYQTENDYKVLVYYRDLGARYDRLVGTGNGNSINISN